MDIEKPPDFFPYFLFLQDTENGLSKCRYTVPVSPSSGDLPDSYLPTEEITIS